MNFELLFGPIAANLLARPERILLVFDPPEDVSEHIEFRFQRVDVRFQFVPHLLQLGEGFSQGIDPVELLGLIRPIGQKR